MLDMSTFGELEFVREFEMALCDRYDIVRKVKGMLVVAQESEASLDSKFRGLKATGTTVGPNYPSADCKSINWLSGSSRIGT